MKQTLSAVIIAKNEADRISHALTSLRFADEIIVIDNGSTDQTKTIAKTHHARVISDASESFSALRNRGKEEAKGTWVLYIDADEVVTEELAREIGMVTSDGLRVRKNLNASRANTQPSDINGYYIPRKNYYLGHPWPVGDTMQRLFYKDALIRWSGDLHESASIHGKYGTLKHPLIHNTHRTLEEMLTKTNEWSTVEAQLRYDAHHPPMVWWRFFRVMWTGFSRSFFHEGGWRMGTVGWIESIYQGFSMFLTYAKLWEMQEKKRI